MSDDAERARFWAKVDKSGDCWLWTRYIMPNGYGHFTVRNQTILAHRFAYATTADIPDGGRVDHICRVRHCVNPSHLQVVTHQENCQNTVARPHGRSGVRGVAWDKTNRKWRVVVVHDGKQHTAGRYTDLATAERQAIALRNRLMTNNLQDPPAP